MKIGDKVYGARFDAAGQLVTSTAIIESVGPVTVLLREREFVFDYTRRVGRSRVSEDPIAALLRLRETEETERVKKQVELADGERRLRKIAAAIDRASRDFVSRA